MRTTVLSVLSLVIAASSVGGADDEGLLTKEGKLRHVIEFREGQGGFAGVTGVAWKIETDGSWSVATFLNDRTTKTIREGKLNEKQLAALASHLTALDVADLPKQLGEFKGANPRSFLLRIGDRTTTVTAGPGQRLTEVVLPGKAAWSRFAAAAAIIQAWTADDSPRKEPK
jgi:hypothetical protein